ncbi:MAG: CAP domain-containing protein [Rubrivivax sp.]|nr:CAP domain-containing protein [Rubrivivax sp.]
MPTPDRLRTLLLAGLRTALVMVAITLAHGGALAAPANAGPDIDGFVRHLAQLINDYRARQGLAPLVPADDLQLLAGEHSADMAARRTLSHDGFDDRFRRSASRICVENVGWNYPTAETLLQGWRQSPAHHQNLLDPKVARMGIAMATHYVTFFACR